MKKRVVLHREFGFEIVTVLREQFLNAQNMPRLKWKAQCKVQASTPINIKMKPGSIFNSLKQYFDNFD